jgi:hypothetical protein
MLNNSGYPFGGYGLNPYVTLTTGPRLVAGAVGVAFNRFGWADPESGQVSNAYSYGYQLGLVLPQPLQYARAGWNLAYWNFGALTLRAGYPVTLAARGDFWVRFPGGAHPNTRVYADMADGTAWTVQVVIDSNGQPVLDSSGYPVLSSQAPGGSAATIFTVMTAAQPGQLALISSSYGGPRQ